MDVGKLVADVKLQDANDCKLNATEGGQVTVKIDGEVR
jgi:hypothetical protein